MREQPNIGDEFEANINEGNQDQTAAERPAETREPVREGRADTRPESEQSKPQESQKAVPGEAREDGNQFPRRQRPDNPADSIDPAQQFPQNPQNHKHISHPIDVHVANQTKERRKDIGGDGTSTCHIPEMFM